MPSTPSNEEQLLLELINRFRTNPAQEASLLAGPGARQDIVDAINFFGVSVSAFTSQLAALGPVAPLAWNGNLADAADGHNAAMIANDTQSHQLPGEPDLGARATNANYQSWSNLGENIYLYAGDALNAHAAFIIDWGYDTEDYDNGVLNQAQFRNRGDGMQDPPGHRVNLISGTYTEVGLSIVAENNPGTEAGPFSVTQDLGTRFGYQPQFVGVAINDIDHDHFYDVGEGLGGVTVTLQRAGNTYTTTTWSSGGYQIAVPAGSYTITFSGGGLTAPVVKSATLGSSNVEVIAEAGAATVTRPADHDFNGDGRSDILWRNGTTGQMGDWLADSNGNFAANASLYSVTTDWRIIGTGDFNGDGKADIVWRNVDGRFGDWFGDAGGNFAANATLYGVGNDWNVLGTGDFNGDGRTDLLWRHNDGRFGTWSADASGNFAANATIYSVTNDWKIAGTGDFNGDGKADILWRNTTTGQFGDWLSNGGGAFTANPTLFNSPLNWHIAETGDFNGDGRTDIVWRSDSGQLGSWLADANGNFTANPTLSSAPVEWKIAETGDYNGDGRADILWRNSNTGQVGDWFADANGNFTANPTLVNAPADWAIFSDHAFLV